MKWKELPQDWIWTGLTADIAEEIRVQMVRRNLRQDAVAAIISLPRQAFARRLSGETRWRYSELDKIATAWGMTVDDLAGESPEIPANTSSG